MNKTQVLIVGACPVGLTLAIELARRSIPFRIIERASIPATGSRAKGLQPRSLEILNEIGITENLISLGYTDLPYRKYNGKQMVGEIPRKVSLREDTRYPGILLLPQYQVEEALRSHLAKLGHDVEWATELADFVQTNGVIQCRLDRSSLTEELTCTYVIGCDGGKSNLRKRLNIKFEGETRQEEQLWVGDVEVEGLKPDAWYNWFDQEFGLSFALFPFKNSKKWQLQAVMKPDDHGNIPEPTIEGFNQLFKERTQMQDVTFTNCTWESIYRVNIRRAERYRVGNMFIAGDACHVHSIAGGMGMNTGIQDAYNLGWKMAAVIREDFSDRLLDTYAEERIPVADALINITSTHHQNLINTAKSGKGGLETIASVDNTQLNLNYCDSSLTLKTTEISDKLSTGDRAPDAQLKDSSWLSDQLRGIQWKLILLGNFDFEPDKSVKIVRANDEAIMKAYGVAEGMILLRPDGYIAIITLSAIDIYKYFERLK